MQSSSTSSNHGADRKILIAVDFGTTYSGVAWAQTRMPDVQTIIFQWPDAISGGVEGVSSDKVPTELLYGNNGQIKWGFQIDQNGPRHQWFKLDLDIARPRQASDLASQYPDQYALPPRYGFTGEKLCTDYLTALRKHVMEILQHKLPVNLLKTIPIEYIITVPAIWSDAAQIKTRCCAEKAGMGKNLQIVSEPEAAAIYALHIMEPHQLNVGDTFVLCDAGGGTVDLISYTITELKPILQVREAAVGTGGLCGSTYINRIFQKFLIDKFEDNEGWDDEVVEEAMKRFELSKKSFRGDITLETEEFFPVPGLHDDIAQGVRRGKLRLTGAQINHAFEPVFQEIVKLVKGQIASTSTPVKAVLMVGGFGQSAYLRERIRASINSSIEVMQSPNGWTAVARGALMKGFAQIASSSAGVYVQSRCARKHYGTECHTEYVSSIHDVNKRFWDGFSGSYQTSAMRWYIKKGSPVKENDPFRYSYSWGSLVADGHPGELHLSVSMCEDHENRGAPIYPDDHVFPLVVLRADLRDIPESQLIKRVGKDGRMYYRLEIEIEMTYRSASTTYALIYNNVKYDIVTAEYV